MLEFVRRAVKSWVMKVFLGLLVASFAVFGIGDVFTASLGSSVATVGNQKITAERFYAEFNREMQLLRQQTGQPIDTQTARQFGLENQVLGRMARNATLDEAMAELNISAPDDAVAETIVNDPSFSGGGEFDEAQYRYALAQFGFSVEGYEDQTRKALARNQLRAALAGAGAPPAGAAEAILAYDSQERRFDYIILDTANHAPEIGAPDDAALAAFHEENAGAFSSLETRDVVYLHIDLNALAEQAEVSEDALRAAYEGRAAIYDRPERRTIFQTVFDDQGAAQAAYDRIQGGETFDAILAERGEGRADAALGDLVRADLPEAAGAAAFALAAEGVTEPFDTGFGYALIDVAAIQPAETVPFEDARDELEYELRQEAALDLVPGAAGEIEDERAAGATLEEVAQTLGLDLGRAAVTREGGDGVTGADAFIEEAFSAETGEERELVETDEGSYFVLRVDAAEPAALRPLDEVRPEVEAAWAASARRDALQSRMDELLARVDDGELLAVVADELGVDMQTEGPGTRAYQWRAVHPGLAQDLFDKPMGGAGWSAVTGRLDAFVLAQVVGIETPEADPEALARLNDALGAQVGGDALALYLTAKQRAIGATVNQPLIDSLLTQSRGGM